MIALKKKELGRKWAALLGRGCQSSAKPCDSTIYFQGVTRKRFTVCSSAAISTGLDRCSSMPASLLFFTSSRKAFAVNACGLSALDLVWILL